MWALYSGKRQVLPVLVAVFDFGEGCFSFVFSRAMAATLTQPDLPNLTLLWIPGNGRFYLFW